MTDLASFTTQEHVRIKLAHSAFTLIELLVVVGIITILALIATVNFMEAQTRAKVSRAKSDIRTIATAVESYRVDQGKYPYPLNIYNNGLYWIYELSTPVAYLTSVALVEPFQEPGSPPTYWYDNYSGRFMEDNPNLEKYKYDGFCLASIGPDNSYDMAAMFPLFIGSTIEDTNLHRLYDPTNGTTSGGDIAWWTGKRLYGN